MEVIYLHSPGIKVGDRQNPGIHRVLLETKDPTSWLCDLSKSISPSQPQRLHLQNRDDNNDCIVELQ